MDGVQAEWRAGGEAACGQMAGEASREAEDGGGWEAAGRAGGEAAGGAGGEAEVAGMEAANGSMCSEEGTQIRYSTSPYLSLSFYLKHAKHPRIVFRLSKFLPSI